MSLKSMKSSRRAEFGKLSHLRNQLMSLRVHYWNKGAYIQVGYCHAMVKMIEIMDKMLRIEFKGIIEQAKLTLEE